MSSEIGVGRAWLSDNAIIRLKILIDDVRETDFSPFGNVYFDVKVVGSVTVESVPGDLKKARAKRCGHPC
jgi:hypothetical protein